MKSSKLFVLSALSVVAIFTSCKKEDDPDTVSSMNGVDSLFITNTYSNINLATENANVGVEGHRNIMVSTYWELVFAEYPTMRGDLHRIVNNKEYSPVGAVSMNAADSNTYRNLVALNKTDPGTLKFDMAYMDIEIAAQQSAIDLCTSEMNSGKDADVKAYAAKYLEKARMFKAKADSIRAELK